MVHTKEHSNDDSSSRSVPLTEAERKVVKIAKEEAVKYIEKKYKLSSLIPFLMTQKSRHEFRLYVWKKICEILGIDREFKSKLLLLFLLISILTLIIGPSHTLAIILKWLGDG